ncbi:hypothetical protein F5H01DRAFT_201864 [Linnemannia elongata]|nr:hypothetical protein F5H01DRAFT_201864 [Linnemannia elongata]
MWTSNGSQHSATIPPTQQQKIDTRVWTLGSRSAPTSCASTTLSRFCGQNNNEQKTTSTAPAAPTSVPRGSSLVGEGKSLGPPHSFFFFLFFFFFFFLAIFFILFSFSFPPPLLSPAPPSFVYFILVPTLSSSYQSGGLVRVTGSVTQTKLQNIEDLPHLSDLAITINQCHSK